MRVLVTGSLRPWDLAASYQRAFASLGHDVDLFGWYDHLERWTRLGPERTSRALLSASGRRWATLDLLLRAIHFRPDLVVLIKTDDLVRGAIQVLRTAVPGCRVVAFHPDDPFNVNRLRGPSHPRASYQMRSVDHYFIWAERLVERVKRVGARAVSYLGFGNDPDLTRPIGLRDVDRARFGAEISFVGNWDPKREAWLAPLAHARDVSLAIWGPDWKRNARDERVLASCRGEAPRGDDLVRAVLCSRASINVLRTQNETAENMRTYEIPACGGVMLAEWSAQQERVFRDGKEAVYARDPGELMERARAITRWPQETLAGMATAALQRSSSHTYADRAQRILELSVDCVESHGAAPARGPGPRTAGA
jgi:spore maturation protein CgeB